MKMHEFFLVIGVYGLTYGIINIYFGSNTIEPEGLIYGGIINIILAIIIFLITFKKDKVEVEK